MTRLKATIRRRLFDVAAALAALAGSKLELPPIFLTSRARVAHGLPPIATLKSDAVRVTKGGVEEKFPGVARLASAGCE
jgi:hypothetical protein